MSLIGTLNIGKNALAVQQAALQTTGNNISNAGNAGYTRQTTSLSTTPDHLIQSGVFVGTGVQLDSISRQIDDALEGRLRAAVSDGQSAGVSQQWLGQVESVFNALGDNDVSSQLSKFFGSWSALANKPQDAGLRQVVIQNGQSVAGLLHDVRSQLSGLKSTIEERLPALVTQADSLTKRVADLNRQITSAEGGGGGTANGLRDQRDAAIRELSTLIDVKTVIQPNGQANVYVGSEPLVLGAKSRGLTVVRTGDGDDLTPEIRFADNEGTVSLKTGQIGGLLDSWNQVGGSVKDVDAMASSLISDLNKIHASGQGLSGFSTVTGTASADDATVPLDDPAAGLDPPPTNGSFVVHVKDKATGLVTSTLVQVDLGKPAGTGTTLNGLATTIDGVAGVNATVSSGKLTVSADSAAVEVSFSQDSSGALASLGMNTFFSGSDARDIAVNQSVVDDPNMLAAAKNGSAGDNQTARLIAGMESQPSAMLGGQSLKDRYASITDRIATAAAASKSSAESTQGVVDTLQAQRESLSGVSLDEEAVNMIREQRAFQGAARLITAVNEMMDTVLNMAR